MRATAAGTGVDGIEVLLITSSGGKGLVFPKVSYLVNVPSSVDTCWWSSRPQPGSSGRCWRSHWLKWKAAHAQGGWETDETVEAAAARETVEEAGVRGSLEVRCSEPGLAGGARPAAPRHKHPLHMLRRAALWAAAVVKQAWGWTSHHAGAAGGRKSTCDSAERRLA